MVDLVGESVGWLTANEKNRDACTYKAIFKINVILKVVYLSKLLYFKNADRITSNQYYSKERLKRWFMMCLSMDGSNTTVNIKYNIYDCLVKYHQRSFRYELLYIKSIYKYAMCL
jgi:hypothetical protein